MGEALRRVAAAAVRGGRAAVLDRRLGDGERPVGVLAPGPLRGLVVRRALLVAGRADGRGPGEARRLVRVGGVGVRARARRGLRPVAALALDAGELAEGGDGLERGPVPRLVLGGE